MKLLQNVSNKFKANKLEVGIVAALLLTVGTIHAINMFHFPYYEDDEGTYMAQAWSFAQHAKLAPYTYWYDHAPAGWMFLALWIKLTGVFTFGFSINSGRVFIFLLFLLSALFVYLIGRKLSGSKAMAVTAVLLFALTPITLALQRRVLLDNIMTFWLLASITLLLYSKQRLWRYTLSGLMFGIAALSKEPAVFLLPAMLYGVYLYAEKEIRKQALTMWILASGLFILLYPLMALVKGELLPAAAALNCNSSHVSLVGTLRYQASRGSGGIMANFWPVFKGWLFGGQYVGQYDDPLIIVGGILSLFLALAIGFRKKPARVLALLGLSYLLFLVRGGEVIYFYILPFIPFLALAIAYSIWFMSAKLNRKGLPPAILYIAFAVVTAFIWLGYDFRQVHNALFVDQTTPQVQAVNWMLSQHDLRRFYAIDMYGYIDLHANNKNSFKHAEYYWKVAGDPAIFSKILHDNYKNINYIALTTQVDKDTEKSNLYLMLPALKDAHEVKSFSNNGGWNVTMYKVNDTDPAQGVVRPALKSCIE